MAKMTKSQMLTALAEKTGMSKKEVEHQTYNHRKRKGYQSVSGKQCSADIDCMGQVAITLDLTTPDD